MAKVIGISVSLVQAIWRAHGLQPHRVRQFKLSSRIDDVEETEKLLMAMPLHARGVFRSIKGVKEMMHDSIADTKANPKPFIWTEDPQDHRRFKQGHQALNSHF
jgi:hypothetical protein